ncbi:YafY family transcriptional regulator [Arthrobacter sp. Sa2CUA1]|uniref:YafY family transcriptional regulator n=1 Tax=Arthrobacter gallicola TaxID=2762225 RepID=A0ABR8UQX7_9MICC|nr:YafY family protein [Arthrobacter gallicola]MBD7994772.1 YafY family transcriptional regulator [Arthrobacter gallicola]
MRASRLLAMLLVLQTRNRMTTRELAERLEVSQRTVLRDVEALSAAGVPVYAERGRRGGIVLLPGSRLNASQLEPAEMEALSLAGLDSAQREELGLAAAHEMATHKIAARQATVAASKPGLADLVIVDNASWLSAAGQATDVAALALDLRGGNRLRVWYRHSGNRQAAGMVVDPYGLASKAGRWYLVADREQEPRLFNLDRLENYVVLPDAAKTRAGQDLRTVWADLRQRTETLGPVVLHARLRANRLDLAGRILGSRLINTGPASRGWCPAEISYPDVESVRQLLQFGDHIEVLSPPEARRRFYELASGIAQRHRPE